MNKVTRWYPLFLIAIVAVVFLSACAPRGAATTPVEEPDSGISFDRVVNVDHSRWERGTRGGRFVRSTFGSDPKSFNVVVAAETSTTDVTAQLYAGAVRRNQLTLEWEPGLAESYVISEDQKSVTFTLRPNLRWSDGAPLTARDFVDGVNLLILNPAVQTNMRNSQVVGGENAVWEFIDERTFKVTVANVYAGLLTLASVPALPMHVLRPVLEQGGPAAINAFWGVDADVTKVVGSGPFVIAEYVPGQRVVLKPNPHFWEKDEWGTQLPYLEEVVYVYLPDQDTQLQRFLANELSFYQLRGEDYATLVDRKAELSFELYNVGPDSGTQFLVFNQNPNSPADQAKIGWFSNRTFRQAMAHLVDRQTIINNIAFGFGYPQYSPIWTRSPYFWQGSEAAAFPFNPNRAAELLDSIDFKDRNNDGFRQDPAGNRISFTLRTNAGNRVREAIGTIFQQEAARVGIEVVFSPEDFNTMVGRLTSNFDWEAIIIGLTGGVDPITAANVFPSRGNLHMIEPSQSSPRRDWERAVDEAWVEANETTDEAQRVRGYEKLQRIWIEEAPWIFTFNAAVIHAYKTNFGNIKPHPVNGYSWDGILSRVYVK